MEENKVMNEGVLKRSVADVATGFLCAEEGFVQGACLCDLQHKWVETKKCDEVFWF